MGLVKEVMHGDRAADCLLWYPAPRDRDTPITRPGPEIYESSEAFQFASADGSAFAFAGAFSGTPDCVEIWSLTAAVEIQFRRRGGGVTGSAMINITVRNDFRITAEEIWTRRIDLAVAAYSVRATGKWLRRPQ